MRTSMALSRRHLLSNLPFIIGFSGHRDIFHADESIDCNKNIKEQVRSVILHWFNHLNPTSHHNASNEITTPIWILTGLAEGADLLAIEVALELQTELGNDAIRVIGCLPMPLENFKQDFEFESDNSLISIEQFNFLVNELRQPYNELIEVKHALTDDEMHQAVNDVNYGSLRNSLYLNQGLFIAKYCNVLVALWDGKKAQGTGGTADIVRYKLGFDIQWPSGTEHSALQAISEFDGQTAGLVHHLPTVRLKNTSVQNENQSVIIDTLSADDQVLINYEPPIGKLYSYHYEQNGQQSELTCFISKEFNTLVNELKYFNEFSANKLSEITEPTYKSPHKSGLSVSQPIFEAADNIALKAQTSYRSLVKWFFIFAIPGFACYEITGNFVNSITGSTIISVTLLAIVACSLIVTFAAKRNLKWKYQLARGVAEGIRIRGFLNLSNIPPAATSIIPRRFRSFYPLFNHAISVAELDWWRQNEVATMDEINVGWLEDQRLFLNSKLQLNASSLNDILYKRPLYASRLFSQAAKTCFRVSIILGALLLLSMISQQVLKVNLFNESNNWLMLTLQYSLMTSGLFALWNELCGYEETAKGYQSLYELYCRAQSLFTGQMSQAKSVMLQDLAKEAMFEHVSWSNAESSTDLKQKK